MLDQRARLLLLGLRKEPATKLTFSTLLALALASAALSGCDRPANPPKQATGKMDQAATGGTTGEKQQDPRSAPPKK